MAFVFTACVGIAVPAGAQTPPGVTVGALTAKVFQNPTDDGAFTATPATAIEFTQSFPVLDFNPPSTALTCSNTVGVDVNTRPFTDVVPQAGGACTTIVVQGNGEQAGVDNTPAGHANLSSFQMELTTSFTVASAGQVTFNFFSDDGWILGIGAGPGGAQPTNVSGTPTNPPASGTTPFSGFQVVGAFNQSTAPTENDVVVNFPAAGTYPIELDYTECCGGELSFTLNANGSTIPPGGPPTTAPPTTAPPVVAAPALPSQGVPLAAGVAVAFGAVLWYRRRRRTERSAG